MGGPPQCPVTECTAQVFTPTSTACLNHLEAKERDDDFRRVREEGAYYTLNGCKVDMHLFNRLRAGLLHRFDRLNGATVTGPVFFGRPMVRDGDRSADPKQIDLRGSNFSESVQLADLDSEFILDSATFGGGLYIWHCKSSAPLRLEKITLRGSVQKAALTIGDCDLNRLELSQVRASGRVLIQDSSIGRMLATDVIVAGDVLLSRTSVGRLEPSSLLVSHAFSIADSRIEQPASLRVGSSSIAVTRSRFAAFRLSVTGATVTFGDVGFDGPSSIGMDPVPVAWPDSWPPLLDSVPRLASVDGVDVSNLALIGMDVSSCDWIGARNLADISISSDVSFGKSPPSTLSRGPQRSVIGAEAILRSRAGGKRPADWLACSRIDDSERFQSVDVLKIADSYRSLRRAAEKAKQDDLADDFYFGEMEMRRRSASGFTWLLLRAYRWLSGYGQRPLRALGATAVSLLAGALVYYTAGLSYADCTGGMCPSEPALAGQALLRSAEAMASIVPPASARALTATGEVASLVLKLLGPLVFGLFLLSVRNRVRRS